MSGDKKITREEFEKLSNRLSDVESKIREIFQDIKSLNEGMSSIASSERDHDLEAKEAKYEGV